MEKTLFNQSGQAFVLALIVLVVIVLGVLTVATGSYTFKSNSKYNLDKLDAVNLSEAGIDKAVAALNASSGSYNGESETTLGNGSYEVKITSIDQSTKKVESTGYIPNKSNPKVKNTVSIIVQKGDGLSFAYGVQVGDGGFSMDGGSRINGSVYSNYDINISGGAFITGDAYVAGGTQPSSDQSTECVAPNCGDYSFGKNISGNDQYDIAQSFKPSTTATLNKIGLKVRKVGTPANAVVKILSDSGGNPNKNGQLATGTLNANTVTTSYPSGNFIEVGFTSNPTLTAGTLYWIVIDTCGTSTSACDNSVNYWQWSSDTLQGYTCGGSSCYAKWSPRWDANGTPSWTTINADLGFKTFMGGVNTKIAGVGSSTIQGSVHANTLTADNASALQVSGDAYYQTESGITVRGSNCSSNQYCHPGTTDPPQIPMPISDANIQEWKDIADDQVYTGNLVIQWPCTTNLERKKYVGNVTVQGGCTINTDTPVWITGNLTVTGGSTVRLLSSYGASSGVVVVDGTITLSGGSKFLGSGTAGSYLTGLSTYSHPTTPAITVGGGNSSSIIYAANGIVRLEGGTNIREVTAKKLILTGGAIVTYESGVANPFFSSGPQGSFSAVKGTYQSE